MKIFENSILEYSDDDLNFIGLQRVLWISPDGCFVVVVDITNEKKMQLPYFRDYDEIILQIESGRERLIDIDPDLRILSPDKNYLSKYKDDRDKKWDIIKDIIVLEPDIYYPRIRGRLVNEVVNKTGKSKKEIYKYLKRYWFYGKTKNGLLKNYFNCGAPGKERIYSKKPGPKSRDGNEFIVQEKDRKIFAWAIKKFHKGMNMDLTRTHQHMCEEKYNSGYYRKYGVPVPIVEPEKAPTLRQFTYWYHNEYSYLERYSKRHGQRKATMEARVLQGNASERAINVGYLYEIDSTPADILLVSEDRKTILGTPTLYIVKDVFSRMVVGFHASLAPASWVEQMVALENAATNKVEFCKQYGIEISEEDWPCYHLPKNILGDRGELKSRWGENLANLKIDVINAPSYRADLKPFVEQHFNITNNKIRELLSTVGAKPSKPVERGDFDPARNAALTIYEFTRFMILQIITYNKSALSKEYFVTKELFNDKVELTPIDVWNWGKNQRLLHEEPRDLIRYNLLPKGNGVVSRYGIEFDNRCYTSKLGIEEGWFESQQIEGEKKVIVSYDPRNVSSIFIRLKNGRLEQCFLTNKYKEYEGLHVEEVKAINRYKREQLNSKIREEKQVQAELHAFTKKMIKDAKEETIDINKNISIYEKQKNKRERRKRESRSIGSENAWTTAKKNNSGIEYERNSEIINFPISNNEFIQNSDKSGVYKQFASKIRERRRNNELLE